MKPSAGVAGDFDRIAAAMRNAPRADTLTVAESSLLKHVPANARRALDVGCGDGTLARALARQGMSVEAIDVSPGMIALAQALTARELRIEYRVADVTSGNLPEGAFDLVCSVAMVHHLPLSTIVPRLAQLVAPEGTLLIQDVTERRGPRYLLSNIIAVLGAYLRRMTQGQDGSPEIARLYADHGVGEQYLSASQVAAEYRPLLPGAKIENRIEWRYTVIWRRPALVPVEASK